jgi:Mg-chelatase subunit ChlI
MKMANKPLLHLVFGGHVKDPKKMNYTDCEGLDIVGIFEDYQKALDAWRGASQAHVDEVNIKYTIVHLHRLLDPEVDQSIEDHEHGPTDD